MTAQVGMPVEYAPTGNWPSASSVPALVYVIDGTTHDVMQVLYYKPASNPEWGISPSGLVRDDTLQAANSWRPVVYEGTVTIESGV